MREKFLETVAEILEMDVSELDMEKECEEYENWDSLRMMDMVLELEEVFSVLIPIEKLSGIKTLRDLYGMIERE